jgi:hypothetical protein
MKGSHNRVLNIIQERKGILEGLEADGNCRITEQDLNDVTHEARIRKLFFKY